MDCVEVCPVDCFYEGENMLVIHPDECIDCGVCVPECPVDAIKPDTDPGLEKWLLLNAEYAKIWPNITIKKAPPPDSKAWEGKPDKLQYFSPNPGAGDCRSAGPAMNVRLIASGIPRVGAKGGGGPASSIMEEASENPRPVRVLQLP